MRGFRTPVARLLCALIVAQISLVSATASAQPATSDAPSKEQPPEPPAQGDQDEDNHKNPGAGPTADNPDQRAKPSNADTSQPSAGDPDKTKTAAPTPPSTPDAAKPGAEQPATTPTTGSFSFGSYGRVIAATDARGGPGRDADIVAHGSRLDESNYVELELRRDDTWRITNAATKLVATLAIGNPIFHYNGDFDVKMAIRNLFIEEKGLIAKDLSVWAGSRMYRGDDIYLLDFWPLDNLNTIGAGARYDAGTRTSVAVAGGLSQPKGLFFKQDVERPSPLNGFGAYTVSILDRQKFIGSLKASHIVPLPGGGLKFVGYMEAHALPAGQKETDPGVFEPVPADNGAVFGAQIGLFSNERSTHVNLFFRYANGLAAFGDFTSPFALALDHTSTGAHELLGAIGGNWETGPFGVMVGGYVRSFRNASPDLDFDDVDEAIIAVRPHVFFGDIGGLALELSHQVQKRGVSAVAEAKPGDVPPAGAPEGPLTGTVTRFGVIPFISPAGRGDYSRPQFRIIYVVTARSDGARALYPQDDVFNLRKVEHFFGVGAEWWFNSSYGGS